MQKLDIVLLSFFGLLAVATARPQGLDQLISFKDGKIGVNFGGYHAEAGLGGLLSGGRTVGGLSASAGTPYGANAQAGLGGLLSGNGYTGGGLHASAGLGGDNPRAAAGIGGELSGEGKSQGGYFAGATTGGNTGLSKSVEAHSFGEIKPAVNVGTNIETEVYKSVPNIQVDKTIDSHVVQSIPNVKTVETHVYKTVPTIRKTVVHHTETNISPIPQQQQQSNVVEEVEKVKTIITPKKQKTKVTTRVRSRVNPNIQSGVIVEKAIYPYTNWNFQTQFNPVQQVRYTNSASAAAGANAGIWGGGFGGGYGGNYENNYYVKSQPNSQLFDDIFNIPISTLTAVNQLLRNKGK